MTETTHSDTTHVINGRIIDPTKDKDPSHWLVRRDPPPDVHIVSFHNQNIGYSSYDPPKGFTVEEIVQFSGAKESRFDLEQARALVALRNEKGTLDVTGDDRWGGL